MTPSATVGARIPRRAGSGLYRTRRGLSPGRGDDDTNHPLLDKTRMAEAEGRNRYARGVAFFRYLQRRRPTALAHRLVQAPNVGHDSDGAFNSSRGLGALYNLPGTATEAER
jgi:hypothetical protein